MITSETDRQHAIPQSLFQVAPSQSRVTGIVIHGRTANARKKQKEQKNVFMIRTYGAQAKNQYHGGKHCKLP